MVTSISIDIEGEVVDRCVPDGELLKVKLFVRPIVVVHNSIPSRGFNIKVWSVGHSHIILTLL